MKRIYCFDLDGTVTRTEILPCIASELGVTAEIATLTAITMQGLIAFEDSLRLRALILGQVPLERIHAIIQEIPLEPTLVAFIEENRASCRIVTGNLDVWIEPLRRRLPCRFHCSQASIAGGRVQLHAILDKGRALAEIRAQEQAARILAIGDGANDVPMLRDADVAIAYGGVHSPMPTAIQAARYVVHEPEALCALLPVL